MASIFNGLPEVKDFQVKNFCVVLVHPKLNERLNFYYEIFWN